VGETGGKDFVVAHPSADPIVTAVALARGAFEYQGQKCSAASRAYIPSNIWPAVKEKLLDDVASFKMGTTEDFGNFMNAVIDETAFDKISAYIEDAKKADNAEIICGGTCDKSIGYFIEPTIILAKDSKYTTMCEEIFGPVLTIYVYDENNFEATLDIVNETSPYALTGSIISTDRQAILLAHHKLKHAAGNFYINDKPTGAVVGQQPFGGARGSGTNDKAGSKLNKIVNGEANSWNVFENANVYAFLDIHPVSRYHTLVIPKKHYENIFDIPEKELKEVIAAVRQLAQLYKAKLGIENLQIINSNGTEGQQDVFHIHFHIVPRKKGDGQNIHWKTYPEWTNNFDGMIKKIQD